MDDEDRENEGDLAIGAEFVTPDAINFMIRHARGLWRVAMTGDRLDALHLPPMVPAHENSSGIWTAVTVSVEARTGVTTGITAHDRARTIQVLAESSTTAADLSRPGHIFPLRANSMGVLARPGQTEASVDLMRLPGLEPAAAICEIMAEDGSIARMPDLEQFAEMHDIGIVTIADLIAHRRQLESIVQRGPVTRLPTRYGDFVVTAYGNPLYPLLTNNPRKVAGLKAHGTNVMKRVPLIAATGPDNRRYLSAKRQQLGLLLDGKAESGSLVAL